MDLSKSRAVFDVRAEEYDKYSDWYKNQGLYELCVEPLSDMVNSVKCIDLAGGPGWVAQKNNLDTGNNWIVYDLSPKMGAHVKEPVDFVVGDAHSVALKEKTFGHIVIRSALQFLDAKKALMEARRILSSRGHLVIAQKVLGYKPDDIEWHDKVFKLKNPFAPQNKYWSIEKLMNLLKECRFKVLKVNSFRERRVADLNRWVSKDGTVPKSKQKQILDMLCNAPKSVVDDTNQVIADGKISYDRVWAIIYSRVETIKSSLTPVAFSMIVERNLKGKKHILLQKRKKRYEEANYYNSWELPQGKLEKDVSAIDTVRQELFDETGLELDQLLEPTSIIKSEILEYGDQLEVLNSFVTVRTSGGTDFLGLAIIVTANGEPRSVDINREHIWVPVDKLENMLASDKFFPLNKPMISEYLNKQYA